MECPSKWTFIAVIIHFTFHDNIFCQNVAPGGNNGNTMVRENRDCSRPPGSPTSTDMFNSILSAAASNGVLPDLMPILQGQSFVDNIQKFPYSQEILTKPLSVFPMPTPGCVNTQEPIIYSSQPIRSPVSNQNVIVATPLSCGSGCPANVPVPPQTIAPPGLPPPNCVSQISQPLPLENYPACTQNVGVVRPMPIVLQPQCQFNEVNPYNFYNQFVEPTPLPEINAPPLNLPILPPSQILPTINTCSGTMEVTPNLVSPCLSQPTVFAGDSQQLPLNLQINVPTPSVPAPRITVVSANPANAGVSAPSPCIPEYPGGLPPFQYPPQPLPIVVGGCSKSSWRKWLPFLLLALLSDRGCNYDVGGCCCCCSCNSNSGNNIPIPYPIPIPINNPVINTCPCPYSSRNREYRDDGDDDDDRKRK